MQYSIAFLAFGIATSAAPILGVTNGAGNLVSDLTGNTIAPTASTVGSVGTELTGITGEVTNTQDSESTLSQVQDKTLPGVQGDVAIIDNGILRRRQLLSGLTGNVVEPVVNTVGLGNGNGNGLLNGVLRRGVVSGLTGNVVEPVVNTVGLGNGNGNGILRRRQLLSGVTGNVVEPVVNTVGLGGNGNGLLNGVLRRGVVSDLTGNTIAPTASTVGSLGHELTGITGEVTNTQDSESTLSQVQDKTLPGVQGDVKIIDNGILRRELVSELTGNTIAPTASTVGSVGTELTGITGQVTNTKDSESTLSQVQDKTLPGVQGDIEILTGHVLGN